MATPSILKTKPSPGGVYRGNVIYPNEFSFEFVKQKRLY